MRPFNPKASSSFLTYEASTFRLTFFCRTSKLIQGVGGLAGRGGPGKGY